MSWWTFVTGQDDEIKTAEDVNASQRALNLARYQDGTYTLAQYQSNLRLLDGVSADIERFDEIVGDEFQEAVEDNVQSLADNIQKTTSNITKGFFSLIPWQVWIVVALVIGGYVFFIMKAGKVVTK